MRTCCLLLAALFIPAALEAQTIRGAVVEYDTKAAISGATIEVITQKGERIEATSDSAGYFVVYPRTAGRVLLRVTHPSFVAERTDTLTARSRETTTVVVRMTRQAIPIAAIVVTARSSSALGGFYERQRYNAYGRYIDDKEIARKRPVSVPHLLRGMNGLEIEEEFGSSFITLRGHGMDRCVPAIYVDGMPRTSAGFDLDDLVSIERLAGVEVYADASAMPFEFTSIGNDCGAVAFWTRPAKDNGFANWKTAATLVVLGAAVLVEMVFLRHKKADISDRGLRDYTLTPQPAAAGTDPVRAQWHRLRPAPAIGG